MANLQNRIEAKEHNLNSILTKKYTVDYFQREYTWEDKHIQALIYDLTSAFLNEFNPNDKRQECDYNNYFLGSCVICEKDNVNKSIIDGQQRLTSLTLFFIYLAHLHKKFDTNNIPEEYELDDNDIEKLIYSRDRGKKSYNLAIDEREHCLNALFRTGDYQYQENDSPSVKNMAARYKDIDENFPDELKENYQAFVYFIDWLLNNVIMAQITTHSDENAYAVFETMNDRGKNLNSTEMLKGYLLSRLDNSHNRLTYEKKWQDLIKKFSKDEDQRFFQAWLRSQYADTIRSGSIGAQNEDFEKIGTRFHAWVRDNLAQMKLDEKQPTDFEKLISSELPFYQNAYLSILQAEQNFNEKLAHVFYIKHWGIAPSLSFPLMLAPLILTDNEEMVFKKINLVARFIETYCVKHSVNSKRFPHNAIRSYIYNLVKEIRGLELDILKQKLSEKLTALETGFSSMQEFSLHGQNKRFIKFLLSRITAWVEQQTGKSSLFTDYYLRINEQTKPFQVEHILENHFERYTEKFTDKTEFDRYRNRFGALLLLPQGTNQSLNDLVYQEKQPHYLKENLLAKSLCQMTYENNPNFLKLINEKNLPFQAHEIFLKEEIQQRQQLYQAICEQMWRDDLNDV